MSAPKIFSTRPIKHPDVFSSSAAVLNHVLLLHPVMHHRRLTFASFHSAWTSSPRPVTLHRCLLLSALSLCPVTLPDVFLMHPAMLGDVFSPRPVTLYRRLFLSVLLQSCNASCEDVRWWRQSYIVITYVINPFSSMWMSCHVTRTLVNVSRTTAGEACSLNLSLYYFPPRQYTTIDCYENPLSLPCYILRVYLLCSC